MTNELTGAVTILTNAVQQMQQWPLAVLLVAFLIALGSVLKALEFFPNRMIPIAVLVAGGVANAFLGDVGSVAPSQRHPEAVLAMQGVLLGFGAWGLHAFILRRFEKFIPFLAGKSGDTIEIKKSDVEK
jgi:hypothetical protein